MEEQRLYHTYQINGVYRTRCQRIAAGARLLAKKMIRAAHAKEKQLLEKSRNRPNRLNLLDSTVCSSARSNFFTKKSCVVRFQVIRGSSEPIQTIRPGNIRRDSRHLTGDF